MHYTSPKHLLKQNIILVTGASAGIGREVAVIYLRFGTQLVLLGRTESKFTGSLGEDYHNNSLAADIVILDSLNTTQVQCQ